MDILKYVSLNTNNTTDFFTDISCALLARLTDDHGERSFSHLSCVSSFPSQHVQYRTFWYVGICEVCALQVMNDILWEGKHIAPYNFKASAFVHTSFCRQTFSIVQNANI